MTSYARLASDLWSRIAAGEWTVGARLPTVVQLAKQYDVSAVTVRGALAVLARQGLIHTRQGRGTTVASQPNLADQHENGLGSAYFASWIAGPEETVRVLAKLDDAAPPRHLADGAPCAPRYVHLRRLHLANDRPVCLVDFFLSQDAYRSLPAGLDEGFKIGLLLMTRADPAPTQGRQVTTIISASPDDAQHLGVMTGSPIVRVERRFLGADGLVMGAGLHRYPGAVFRQVIDQPVDQILLQMGSWLPSRPADDTVTNDLTEDPS